MSAHKRTKAEGGPVLQQPLPLLLPQSTPHRRRAGHRNSHSADGRCRMCDADHGRRRRFGTTGNDTAYDTCLNDRAVRGTDASRYRSPHV